MSKLYKEEKEISLFMNSKGFVVDIIHKVNGKYVQDSEEISYSVEDILKETLKFYTIGFNIDNKIDIQDKLQTAKIGNNDKSDVKLMIKNLRNMANFLERSLEDENLESEL